MKIFNFDGILKESGSRVITKINASANQVDSNTPASVEEETDNGTLNLTFNIPKGASGANMFYKGTAAAHYSNFNSIPSEYSENDSYILDSSSEYSEIPIGGGDSFNGYSAPSIATYVSAPDHNWNVTKAIVGDIYRVGDNLWQAQENNWVDMGSFKGDQGEDGTTPYIDSNTGNWFISNTDTGINAKGSKGDPGIDGKNGEPGKDGEDGFSPTATVNKVGKVATITITDKNGEKTVQVNDGLNGTNGTDGFSPTATVTKSGKITTISITDKNGTTTAEIKDGSDESGSSGGNVIITLSDYDNLENRDSTITYFITD